jgi:twinfilin-like protein
LTPEGYAAHLRHNSAPQPLSAREAEIASIRAAEKAAGLDAYKGASERKSHVGAVGLSWTDEVEAALKELAESSQNTLVLLVSHISFVFRLFVVDEGCLAVDRPRE